MLGIKFKPVSVPRSQSGPRMKNRRSSSDAKEHILQTAEEALIDVGLKGLKLKALADRAKMRYPNIIYHFGSIEGVRKALMSRLIGRMTSQVIQIIQKPDGQDFEDRATIRSSIMDIMFEIHSQPYMVSLIAWKISNNPNNPIEEIELIVESLITIVSKKLEGWGLVEQAKRENVLTAIHMGLSVVLGRMLLISLLPESLKSVEIDDALKKWIVNSIAEMTEPDQNT